LGLPSPAPREARLTDPTARLSAALADRYRIERELGQGGMATVYLAEDLKHDRKVALKVLKPELAAVLGADRFVVEIKTTAALQHPHILPLYDSGRTGGRADGRADEFLFYVMPYIQGETLRQKLDREHQLGVDDAVRLASQVADALDYAHRHGVIHRDIKPENILLHEGRPMVSDFGIALAVSAAAGGRMTETGLSLGTPHYMSPEQATAEKEITGRSDIYSLGSVLYEMLAGEPPHSGGSAQQIIMKIVTEEAQPVTQLRKSVPPHVAAAVGKALERLPADRFASAAEFAAALGNRAFGAGTATGSASAAVPAAAGGRRARLRDPFVLVPSLVAVAAIAAGVIRGPGGDTPPTLPSIRFRLAPTDSTRPVATYPWPAAISPDGGTIVYTVASGASSGMLVAQRMDQLQARPIPGTIGGYQPYFSPDGAWLAFEAGGKERKVRLDGSAPVTITDANGANGADWTARDVIVLGAQGRFHGLSHVSAAGGEAAALTEPDTANNERDHLWPVAFPDGRTIAFVIWSGSLGSSRLALTSLDDGRVTPLGIPGIRPLAVLDGVLVYLQADGTVMGVPVDAGRRRTTGQPIPVHDPVWVGVANNGNSGIFISPGGALVTGSGATRGRLVWVRPDGGTERILPDARSFVSPRLSPDERRIAVVASEGQQSDVWILDRTLATFSRLTLAGTVTSAAWAADGSRLVFTAAGETARNGVWSQLAAGGSPPELLFETPQLTPSALIAPDGRSLLVTSLEGNTWGSFRIPLDSARVARTYLASGGGQMAGTAFSPDGKWMAVASDESGQYEIYVRSFPDPASRIQISVAGGSEAVWSRDGRRIYYRAGTALLAARVSLTPTFTLLGRDTVLTGVTFTAAPGFVANYDVTRDGQRIVAIQPDVNDFEVVVAPNWITEFRRRLAEARGR